MKKRNWPLIIMATGGVGCAMMLVFGTLGMTWAIIGGVIGLTAGFVIQLTNQG